LLEDAAASPAPTALAEISLKTEPEVEMNLNYERRSSDMKPGITVNLFQKTKLILQRMNNTRCTNDYYPSVILHTGGLKIKKNIKNVCPWQ